MTATQFQTISATTKREIVHLFNDVGDWHIYAERENGEDDNRFVNRVVAESCHGGCEEGRSYCGHAYYGRLEN